MTLPMPCRKDFLQAHLFELFRGLHGLSAEFRGFLTRSFHSPGEIHHVGPGGLRGRSEVVGFDAGRPEACLHRIGLFRGPVCFGFQSSNLSAGPARFQGHVAQSAHDCRDCEEG